MKRKNCLLLLRAEVKRGVYCFSEGFMRKCFLLSVLIFFVACTSDNITSSSGDDILQEIGNIDTFKDIFAKEDIFITDEGIVNDIESVDKVDDIVTMDITIDILQHQDIFFDDLIDFDVVGEADSNIYDIEEGFEDATEFIDYSENLGDILIEDVSKDDAGIKENYDRLLVVSHPFGKDGSTCGRYIEFFTFSEVGSFLRLNDRVEVGDCPIKVKFSPDGLFLFVIVNNGHNPQAGTQAVVVLKKNIGGKFVVYKEFSEFSKQNPEYIAFKRDGNKVFIADFDIEGNGGIHIITKDNENWIYKKEIPIALPKAMVVLPDDRFMVVVAGKEPYDIAVLDIEREEIVSQYDLFNDFVDALGIDVTPDGKYIVIPNSSPYSELGNTLSILRVSYSDGIPTLSLESILSNVNEPSASLFTTDGKYLVVTNFSKNYTSLYAFNDGKLDLLNRVTSMSLADAMTTIRKGDFKDYFFVNALLDIHILNIQDNQLIRVLRFSLGSGNENMLGDIDIEP